MVFLTTPSAPLRYKVLRQSNAPARPDLEAFLKKSIVRSRVLRGIPTPYQANLLIAM